MVTPTYERLTSSPLFMSRPLIQETISLLAGRCDSARAALSGLLDTSPLPQPDQHTGDSSPDYFDTTGLSDEILENICDQLFEAEAEAVPPSGQTTREASRIAALVDLWLERNEAGAPVTTPNSEQTSTRQTPTHSA